jgi:hypothetical protein
MSTFLGQSHRLSQKSLYRAASQQLTLTHTEKVPNFENQYISPLPLYPKEKKPGSTCYIYDIFNHMSYQHIKPFSPP